MSDEEIDRLQERLDTHGIALDAISERLEEMEEQLDAIEQRNDP